MPAAGNMDGKHAGTPEAAMATGAEDVWLDLKDALLLFCRDAGGLASDWHKRGPFPALVDIPDLQAWRFDPHAGTLELWFGDPSQPATIKLASPAYMIDEIEALREEAALSGPALAEIEAGLSVWLQGYTEMMLGDVKAGHIELRGRPGSLFALDQRIPDHVLPFLDDCDLKQGTLALSNGERIYLARVRFASAYDPDRESARRQAFLAGLKKAHVVKPRLAWLITKYQQDALPSRAPGDFRDCEDSLDKTALKDERRRRSFGQARAWYRLIKDNDWWAAVAPILR